MTTNQDEVAKLMVTRRTAMLGAAGAAATAATPAAAAAAPAGEAVAQARGAPRIIAYVGTYTDKGKGIHLFSVNTETGKLTPIKEVSGVANPSALAFDPAKKYLFAANEIANFENQPTGAVSAFAIDRATGDLRALNSVSSGGKSPAFLSVEPGGKFVLVANYDSTTNATNTTSTASVAVLPIGADGRLGAATDVQMLPSQPLGPHHGTGAPTGSFADSGHDAPHAHQAITDPTGRFVLVSDLGTDRIYVYRFDKTAGKLAPNDPAFYQAAPGTGPRHLSFHPNGRFAYSLHEESSTMDFLTWDGERGRFEKKQTLSTLPHGYEGTNYPSEIEVSDDGRHVYAANRLHDTIASFAIGRDGMLTYLREAWTRGSYPRNFATEPTKKFVYVLHSRSDNVTIFKIDRATGTLSFTDQYVGVGNPSQIVFLTL
jgi:6-phosphogluconolactonase (cycloisomerase 2 family)